MDFLYLFTLESDRESKLKTRNINIKKHFIVHSKIKSIDDGDLFIVDRLIK